MIYRTRIDAVEKLLDSKEIKYTGEVISLSEFEDIICQDIREYGLLDKYNELEESYFKGKVGFNFSGNILKNSGISYCFNRNHFMKEPIVSIAYKSCGDKPIFIGESYNVEEMVKTNQDAIKKRTPIEISTLNSAFVKKIEKYK